MVLLQRLSILVLILLPTLSFAQDLPIDAWDFFQMLKRGSGSLTPRGSPRGSPRISPRHSGVIRAVEPFVRAVDVEPNYLAEMQKVRDSAKSSPEDFTVSLINPAVPEEVTLVSFDEKFEEAYANRAKGEFYFPRVDHLDDRSPRLMSTQWMESYHEFRNFIRAVSSNEWVKAKMGIEGRLMLLVPVQANLHMVFQEAGTSPTTTPVSPIQSKTHSLRMIESNE